LANFTHNQAQFGVSAKHARNPWPGFSQLFFSFLTFLLLFAQYGGAIANLETMTVEHGNFTGNSVADGGSPANSVAVSGASSCTRRML
jgi:hypothetical protein